MLKVLKHWLVMTECFFQNDIWKWLVSNVLNILLGVDILNNWCFYFTQILWIEFKVVSFGGGEMCGAIYIDNCLAGFPISAVCGYTTCPWKMPVSINALLRTAYPKFPVRVSSRSKVSPNRGKPGKLGKSDMFERGNYLPRENRLSNALCRTQEVESSDVVAYARRSFLTREWFRWCCSCAPSPGKPRRPVRPAGHRRGDGGGGPCC